MFPASNYYIVSKTIYAPVSVTLRMRKNADGETEIVHVIDTRCDLTKDGVLQALAAESRLLELEPPASESGNGQ